jgi:hypothetical protein
MSRRYNTRNCRLHPDDKVVMKYAKGHPVQVSGGRFPLFRSLAINPWERIAAPPKKEVK